MKFETADRSYLSKRARLSEKTGPRELWSVADHWPLYCGIGNLARYVAILDILRRSLPIPGHVAELGTWRGATLCYLAKLLRILDPHGSKQVHCFDSFEGLKTFTGQDGQALRQDGAYKGNLEELREFIGLYELEDDIVIHEGFLGDTLPSLLESRPSLSFSLIYLDMDLYAPTLEALRLLHPRLSEGGMFVFDEWNHDDYPGETVAAREFLDEHGRSYRMEHVPGARQPSMVLVKRPSLAA